MDKSLQLFNFKDQPVRVVIVDGKPNWVLADVCKVLELGQPHRVADRLDPKGVTKSTILSDGGPQEMLCINEPNLYRTIFRSNKKQAKDFQDWVFEEVLPAIRQTGSYSVPRKELSNSQIAANPELALQTLELHKSMRLAFYRSARDWQGLVNILYPEHKKSGKSSKAQPPKVVIYQGEEIAQLMIGFNQDIA